TAATLELADLDDTNVGDMYRVVVGGAGTKKVTSDVALVQAGVPSEFTVGMWTVTATGVTGEVELEVTAEPDNNGSEFTAFEYRIDGGTAVELSGVGIDVYTIDGLTDD